MRVNVEIDEEVVVVAALEDMIRHLKDARNAYNRGEQWVAIFDTNKEEDLRLIKNYIRYAQAIKRYFTVVT